MSDLAISAQKYPKSVTQENGDVVFYMFMVIKKTFNQYKNCSLHETGEGNVVSALAISAQKYPKIVTQEKETF